MFLNQNQYADMTESEVIFLLLGVLLGLQICMLIQTFKK